MPQLIFPFILFICLLFIFWGVCADIFVIDRSKCNLHGINFSSEIQCGIRESGNEFSLNRIAVLKIK